MAVKDINNATRLEQNRTTYHLECYLHQKPRNPCWSTALFHRCRRSPSFWSFKRVQRPLTHEPQGRDRRRHYDQNNLHVENFYSGRVHGASYHFQFRKDSNKVISYAVRTLYRECWRIQRKTHTEAIDSLCSLSDACFFSLSLHQNSCHTLAIRSVTKSWLNEGIMWEHKRMRKK